MAKLSKFKTSFLLSWMLLILTSCFSKVVDVPIESDQKRARLEVNNLSVPLDFGIQSIPASPVKQIQFKNLGQKDATLDSITFTSGEASAYIADETSTCVVGGTLRVNETCIVDINFTPTVRTTYNDSISLSYSDNRSTYSVSHEVKGVGHFPGPAVTGVAFTSSDGSYLLSSNILIQINFADNVLVDTSGGSPKLLMETGAVDNYATYLSGSGTSALLFQYTVSSGDTSLDFDYSATTSLELNGGKITDSSSDYADITLPQTGTLATAHAIVVDGVQATVEGVDIATADGIYKISSSIDISLTFSEAVTVDITGGTPRIQLETGASDQYANYQSGSGSDTLVFTYTVVQGDLSSDLDYLATNSLTLEGGSIQNNAGNNSLLTLPAVGTLAVANAIAIDGLVPTLTSVSINSGATTTSSSTVSVNLIASDTGLGISHFCLKSIDTNAPSASDSCWNSVTTTNSLSVSNHSFNLGAAAYNYAVNAWVKDLAGNISSLTASGFGTEGQDKYTIDYQPGNPPEIKGLIASNTDSPSNPILNSELDTSGGTVVVKWKVTDSEGLPSSPINISYTTDNVNYTTVATGLSNSSNGGCTADSGSSNLDDGFTGCYQWNTAVPSSYFQILVEASDESSQTTKLSNFLNPGPLNILAGNTDLGTDSSAIGNIFQGLYLFKFWAFVNTLVTADDGTVFVVDKIRGIVKISPTDGVATVFLPMNYSLPDNNGDGGPVSSATIRAVTSIAIDNQNNLYLHDGNRIRKVDRSVTPNTIDTIIGGGADTSATVNNALDFQMSTTINIPTTSGMGYHSNHYRLVPLPDGKLIFASAPNSTIYDSTPAAGYSFRMYDPNATPQITSISPFGTGTFLDAGVDVTTCNHISFGVSYDTSTSNLKSMIFQVYGGACTASYSNNYSANPLTYESLGQSASSDFTPGGAGKIGVILTGMNGKMYTVSRRYGSVYEYDDDSKTWTHILGSGFGGNCDSGTLATSCKVELEGFFASKQGKYFYRSRGAIYTIDNSGNIQLLYGQPYSYGEGLSPLVARFKDLISFGAWDNAGTLTISALDLGSSRIREFPITGTLSIIAGNGEPDETPSGHPYSVDAVSTSLYTTYSNYTRGFFAQNYTNGNIYMGNGNYAMAMLNRSTGQWDHVAGTGSGSNTDYYYSDTSLGLNGVDIRFNGVSPVVLGVDMTNNQVLMQQHKTDMQHTVLRLYNFSSNFAMSALAGDTSGATSSGYYLANCSDGATSASCTIGHTVSIQLSQTFDPYGDRWLFAQLNQTAVSAFSRDAVNKTTVATLGYSVSAYTYFHDASNDVIYYCSTNGGLYKYDIGGGNIETSLSHNIPDLVCTGRTMKYIPSRNSFIFIFERNGLSGIAEYFL